MSRDLTKRWSGAPSTFLYSSIGMNSFIGSLRLETLRRDPFVLFKSRLNNEDLINVEVSAHKYGFSLKVTIWVEKKKKKMTKNMSRYIFAYKVSKV